MGCTGSVWISSLLDLLSTMNTSPNKRPAMDTWISRPTKKMDGMDLARVADMMDVWTRNENTAYDVKMQTQRALIEKLVDENIRMANQLGNRNRFIAELTADNEAVGRVLEMTNVASEGMQNIIALQNQQLNSLVPDRMYQHVMASDQMGVVHAVMIQRQGFEVVDLTGDLSGDTTEFESDEDMESLLIDM